MITEFNPSKYIGMTRKELLQLPIEERQEIIKWQIFKSFEHVPEKQLLEEFHNYND